MGGNPGKVLEFFFENARSNPPKFENDLNGRLSEQQFKAKIIYRKGGAKRSISLVKITLTAS